jgi:hypothetical protein
VNALATDSHAYGPDRAPVSTSRHQRRNRSGPGIVVGRGADIGAAGGIKKSSSRRPSSVNVWTANLPRRRELDSPARSSLPRCRETTERSIPVRSARSAIEAVRETRSTNARLSRFGSLSPAATEATATACLRLGTASSAACQRLLWIAELFLIVPSYRQDPCTAVHATPGRPH